MKTFVTAVRFALLAVVAVASASVFAVADSSGAGCARDSNGDCIVIVVVESGGGGGGTIYLPDPPPNGGAGSGGVVGSGGTSVAALDEAKFTELFKKVQAFCIRSSETCTDWETRVADTVCKGYIAAVSFCVGAAHLQWEKNCPDIPKCPVG